MQNDQQTRYPFYLLLVLGLKEVPDEVPASPDAMAALVESWIQGTDGHIGNYANGGDEHCWVEDAKAFPTLETFIATLPEVQQAIAAMDAAITTIDDDMVQRSELTPDLYVARQNLVIALQGLGIEVGVEDAEAPPLFVLTGRNLELCHYGLGLAIDNLDCATVSESIWALKDSEDASDEEVEAAAIEMQTLYDELDGLLHPEKNTPDGTEAEIDSEVVALQKQLRQALELDSFAAWMEWVITINPKMEIVDTYNHPIISYLRNRGIADITLTNLSIDHKEHHSLLGSAHIEPEPYTLPLNIVGEWLPALLEQQWGADIDRGIQPKATAQDVLTFLQPFLTPAKD